MKIRRLQISACFLSIANHMQSDGFENRVALSDLSLNHTNFNYWAKTVENLKQADILSNGK